MATLFATVLTGNQDLNRVQANVQQALQTIQGQSPFVGGGVFLTGIKVGTGATVIAHGLGRTPIAWVICDQNTNTNVWRTAWGQNSITLQAGSGCTISLWVN